MSKLVNICSKCGLAALSLAGRPAPDNRHHGISMGTCQCCRAKNVGVQDRRDFGLSEDEVRRVKG